MIADVNFSQVRSRNKELIFCKEHPKKSAAVLQKALEATRQPWRLVAFVHVGWKRWGQAYRWTPGDCFRELFVCFAACWGQQHLEAYVTVKYTLRLLASPGE